MQTRINSNGRFVIIFTHLAIVFTIFSQMLEIQALLRPLMFACWCLAFIYALLAKRAVYINSYIKTYALAMLFIVFHNIICFFINNRLQISNYLKTASIPLFVFFTMFQIAGYINSKQFRNLVAVYCICTIILAIYIHIKYLPSLENWLNAKVYIYTSKNSAAQIFASTIIILLFYFKDIDKRLNIIKYGIIVYLVVIITMIQCRTALLALIVAFLYYFFVKATPKQRIYLTIVLLFIAVLVISNKRVNDIFVHAFNLDNYEDGDLNKFSSGRIDSYIIAFESFSKTPLTGTVSYYVDCMYISVYTALGIFGGTALMIPWFKRIFRNGKSLRFAQKHKINANLESAIFYMTIYYFVTAIFEGLPPFGPGATSAMFWLCCSYMDYTYYKPNKGSFKSLETDDYLSK